LYFSSAQIWEQFIPLCFQLLEVGAAPVRAAAAAAAASLMRHNKRAAQRADIAQRLVRDFAEGASAAQRILFLDFCAAVRKVASTRLFRDYFLHAAVDLLMVRNGRSRASVLSGSSGTLPFPFWSYHFSAEIWELGGSAVPSHLVLSTSFREVESTKPLGSPFQFYLVRRYQSPREASYILRKTLWLFRQQCLKSEGFDSSSHKGSRLCQVFSAPGSSSFSGLLDDKEVSEGAPNG
jgi:hypothetical protein